MKGEIFTQGVYFFETTNPQPLIIDAGAHIGLSTLYFKKIYPHAEIMAIEPNPLAFQILEKNIFENQLDDVHTHQVALSDREDVGEVEFFMDKTDDQWLSTASFTSGAWTGTQESKSILVPTALLSDFLTRPVDFLKMDIEGAEQPVLTAAQDKLHLIKQMIIEFHPLSHQSLQKLVQFLQDRGFQTKIWKDGKEIQPKRARGLSYIEAIRKTT